MLSVLVERSAGRVGVRLRGADGGMVAAWEQPEGLGDLELFWSHDRAVALVVVDEVITVVRPADGRIVASGRQGRDVEVTLPVGGGWTLELVGELAADRGHTGFQGGGVGFWWSPDDPLSPGERAAEAARMRAELTAAASRPFRHRLALGTTVVHETFGAPADGIEVLLWPPVAGPTGVLVRHARLTDEGNSGDWEPQHPWLVRADGTVEQLPFELGVSPLTALDGDRWLLPGWDTVWRDDHDEPLSVMDVAGETEPLLVGGRPVPPSRLLNEAAPELHASIEPPEPNQDVNWAAVAARLDADELRVTIEVNPGEDVQTLLVVALPLAGDQPARELARFESTATRQIAVVP